MQKKENEYYWVYILLCENNSFYTGYTDNLKKRYLSHVNGTARCKYTRSFRPVCIAQCWKIKGDKSLALQFENHIKKLSRIEKEKLIKSPLLTDRRIQVIKKSILCKYL